MVKIVLTTQNLLKGAQGLQTTLGGPLYRKKNDNKGEGFIMGAFNQIVKLDFQ